MLSIFKFLHRLFTALALFIFFLLIIMNDLFGVLGQAQQERRFLVFIMFIIYKNALSVQYDGEYLFASRNCGIKYIWIVGPEWPQLTKYNEWHNIRAIRQLAPQSRSHTYTHTHTSQHVLYAMIFITTKIKRAFRRAIVVGVFREPEHHRESIIW